MTRSARREHEVVSSVPCSTALLHYYSDLHILGRQFYSTRLLLLHTRTQSRRTISATTMPESGPNSGGDLFDMAKDGTTVPEDAAKPRLIPSKPRPDQIASDSDPNALGSSTLAGAADNAGDIPRVSR